MKLPNQIALTPEFPVALQTLGRCTPWFSLRIAEHFFSNPGNGEIEKR
jgi:hypothetical protein